MVFALHGKNFAEPRRDLPMLVALCCSCKRKLKIQRNLSEDRISAVIPGLTGEVCFLIYAGPDGTCLPCCLQFAIGCPHMRSFPHTTKHKVECH